MKTNDARLHSISQRQPVTAAHAKRERLTRRLQPVTAAPWIGAVPVRTDWLTVPVSDAWMAAYRLVSRGAGRTRTTEIAEVRIYPHEPGSDAGDWSGVRAGRSARLPAERFSFARVRQTLTEGAFKRAMKAITANLAQQTAEAFDRPTADRTRGASRDRGRPGLPVHAYAELALRYDELEAERDSGESTRRRLARECGVGEAAIAKRLQQARRLGFLEQVKPGQRGGHATPLAVRIVEGRR